MTRTRSLFAAACWRWPSRSRSPAAGATTASDQDPQEVLDATLRQRRDREQRRPRHQRRCLRPGDQGSFNATLEGPFQGDADDPAALPQLDLAATRSGEGAGQSIDFDGGLTSPRTTPSSTTADRPTSSAATRSSSSSRASRPRRARVPTPRASRRAARRQSRPRAATQPPATSTQRLVHRPHQRGHRGRRRRRGGPHQRRRRRRPDRRGPRRPRPVSTDRRGSGRPGAARPGGRGDQRRQLRRLRGRGRRHPAQARLHSRSTRRRLPSATPVPVDSVDLGFSVALSDVNEEQTIDAPADAQPIDDLLASSALGGLGAAGRCRPRRPRRRQRPRRSAAAASPVPAAATPTSTASSRAGSDPEKAADCLDELQ